MTSREGLPIRSAFDKTFPRSRVQRLAEDHGAMTRRLRKMDMRALVLSLALGGLDGVGRTLESMRRLYQRIAGHEVARSSFHDRLNEGLAATLRTLVEDALASVRPATAAAGRRIDGLRAILLTDSTVIRLHPGLAADYPGAWAHHSPAAAKLTVVTDLGARCIQRLKLGPGSHHDVHHLEPDDWLRDTLLIADRAFTACWKLRELEAVGGFYIGSIRANTNPIVVATTSGLPKSAIGRRVRTVERLARGNELDIEVDIGYQRRNESGVLKVLTHRCRLVGRRRRETGAFDYWITNLPPSSAGPVDVAALYASRWDIEIFFRELKTTWRADQIPTSGRAATECLLYASILAVLLSRVLHNLLLDSQQARDAPAERWARLVRAVAADLAILVGQSCASARDALAQHARLLRHEGRDPNRKRRRPGDRPLPSTLQPA